MPKLERKNVKIFAEKSSENQLSKFGSIIRTGTMEFSNDINELQTEEYEKGWEAGVLAGKAPFREDFNSLQRITTEQIKYLYQRGYAEWHKQEIYYKGSRAYIYDKDNFKVDSYISKIDNNIGHNPVEDGTEEYWKKERKQQGGFENCISNTITSFDKPVSLNKDTMILTVPKYINVLIPDGLNEDGTLNNIELEIQRDQQFDLHNYPNGIYDIVVNSGGVYLLNSNAIFFGFSNERPTSTFNYEVKFIDIENNKVWRKFANTPDWIQDYFTILGLVSKQGNEVNLTFYGTTYLAKKQDLEVMKYETDLPVASIIPYLGGDIPYKYLLCDGASLSIKEFNALYNKIGTKYGGTTDKYYGYRQQYHKSYYNFNLNDERDYWVDNLEPGLHNIYNSNFAKIGEKTITEEDGELIIVDSIIKYTRNSDYDVIVEEIPYSAFEDRTHWYNEYPMYEFRNGENLVYTETLNNGTVDVFDEEHHKLGTGLIQGDSLGYNSTIYIYNSRQITYYDYYKAYVKEMLFDRKVGFYEYEGERLIEKGTTILYLENSIITFNRNIDIFKRDSSRDIEDRHENIAYVNLLEQGRNMFKDVNTPFGTMNLSNSSGSYQIDNNWWNIGSFNGTNITANTTFSPGNKPWKIRFFVYISNINASVFQRLFRTGDTSTCSVLYGIDNGKFTIWISSNGTSWNLVSFNQPFTPTTNKWYDTELIFNGTQYIFRWTNTSDRQAWQETVLVNSTKPIFQNGSKPFLFSDPNGTHSLNGFCSLYNSWFEIDGKKVFEFVSGYQKISVIQGSNFIDSNGFQCIKDSSLDIDGGWFQLPSMMDRVLTGGGALWGYGKYIDEQLPNITGQFKDGTLINQVANGAFGQFALTLPCPMANVSPLSVGGIDFYASRCNGAYGRDKSRVMPYALAVKFLIKYK